MEDPLSASRGYIIISGLIMKNWHTRSACVRMALNQSGLCMPDSMPIHRSFEKRNLVSRAASQDDTREEVDEEGLQEELQKGA